MKELVEYGELSELSICKSSCECIKRNSLFNCKRVCTHIEERGFPNSSGGLCNRRTCLHTHNEWTFQLQKSLCLCRTILFYFIFQSQKSNSTSKGTGFLIGEKNFWTNTTEWTCQRSVKLCIQRSKLAFQLKNHICSHRSKFPFEMQKNCCVHCSEESFQNAQEIVHIYRVNGLLKWRNKLLYLYA